MGREHGPAAAPWRAELRFTRPADSQLTTRELLLAIRAASPWPVEVIRAGCAEQPAAAPLPVHIEHACHILRNNYPALLAEQSYGDIVRAHISALTSRVAELEEERDKFADAYNGMEDKHRDAVARAEAAEAKCAALEAERERVMAWAREASCGRCAHRYNYDAVGPCRTCEDDDNWTPAWEVKP